MQLNYWKNPNRNDSGAERIYVNGLSGLPGDCKVWVESNRRGDVIFRCKDGQHLGDQYSDIGAVERAVLEHLALAGLLANGERPSFKQLLTIAQQATLLKASQKARTPSPLTRHEEALQLDINSIKIEQPVTIQIDHREPPELVAIVGAHPNVKVIYDTALDIGDVLIEDTIVVERKCCTGENRATDFENSIIEEDKRLFYQSERIKLDQDRFGVVILEGDVYGKSQRMLVQQIDGAISFLAAIQQLSVLCTYNLNHTAYLLVKLASHLKNGLGYELGLRNKKHVKIVSQQRFVLEGLPGVNGATADRLLTHFGSIRAVANASYEKLLEVPMIGPKRARQIVDVLNGKYISDAAAELTEPELRELRG